MLVAVNSVFQIVAYSLLGWFYLDLLPGWLGLGHGEASTSSVWDIASVGRWSSSASRSLAGFLTRTIGERAQGREWYEQRSCPGSAPSRSTACCSRSSSCSPCRATRSPTQPLDVVRIAIPLLVYFALMWGGSFALGLRLGLPYDRNATVAFTAAGNNFELAIAVAIGVFGVTSGQALAGAVGPLIEVPVLVGLVYVALWARGRFYPAAVVPAPPRPGRRELAPRPRRRSPGVLFLCVHNAGRSQMALGWFTRLAGDRAVAWSGGSEPARELNPMAIAAMAEVGIDISGEVPSRWTEEVVRAVDVVVTMGCGDACPVVPGTRREDWALDDPAGQDLATVRRVRDEVRAHVEALLADLGITPRPSPPQGDASAS